MSLKELVSELNSSPQNQQHFNQPPQFNQPPPQFNQPPPQFNAPNQYLQQFPQQPQFNQPPPQFNQQFNQQPPQFNQFNAQNQQQFPQKPQYNQQPVSSVALDNAKQYVITYYNKLGQTPEAQHFSAGPDHAKIFQSQLMITVPGNHVLTGLGEGKTKKEAEKYAYFRVYEQLVNGNFIISDSALAGGNEEIVISRKKEVNDYSAQFCGGEEPQIHWASMGPHHLPTFRATITLRNWSGTGTAKTKKDAEKIAYAALYADINSKGM